MKTSPNKGLVLVTAPDLRTARRLAKLAVEARLAACANLIPRIESHYRWQGRVENSREVLILFKTTRPRAKDLERLVLAEHPYDTPEIVFLPVNASTPKYLRWWVESVKEG